MIEAAVRRCGALAAVLVCWAGSLQAAASVQLADADWPDEQASAPLRAALLGWHRAWGARDLAACKALLAADVVRAVQAQPAIAQGREAVLAALPQEWSAYERRADGTLALRQVLRQVHVRIEGDAALLHYLVETEGGTLWRFDDLSAQVALFRRTEARWQLVFQADAGNLEADPDSGAAGTPNFSYDYVLPVQQLPRAQAFYRPLLGAPEAVVDGVAVYELGGSRLYLDSRASAPAAPPRRGLPNGWPIIHPADYAAALRDAAAAGVDLRPQLHAFGGLQLRYGYEPGGSLVALAAPRQPLPGPGQLRLDPDQRGARPSAAQAQAEAAWLQHWRAAEVDALLQQLAPDAAVLEASASRTQAWAQRRASQRRALEGGVRASAASVLALGPGHAVRAGPWLALARQRDALGAPPWQRRTHALQTLVLGAGERIEVLLLAERSGPTALALAFDYAGIPATAAGWNSAARALRALTGAQSSYTDEGWLGLWGERAVLGLYEVDPAIDHLPRRRAASTYLSLWVRDLEGALETARRAGAELPVVPAINTRAGIDRNPGYRQVYLSDSEGNGLVLTEYTGRPSM